MKFVFGFENNVLKLLSVVVYSAVYVLTMVRIVSFFLNKEKVTVFRPSEVRQYSGFAREIGVRRRRRQECILALVSSAHHRWCVDCLHDCCFVAGFVGAAYESFFDFGSPAFRWLRVDQTILIFVDISLFPAARFLFCFSLGALVSCI